MERRTIQHLVTGVGFLLIIFVGGYRNIRNLTVHETKNLLQTTFVERPTVIEHYINENVMDRNQMIDSYGAMQTIMKKEEENNFEVIKDTLGKLHYSHFALEIKDTAPYVKQLKSLQKKQNDRSIELLYVMPPDKVIEGYTEFTSGLPYAYANETADDFLRRLEEEGINQLDLRDNMMQSGIAYEDLFFDGDHHWTIPTAFWAFTHLVSTLELEYGISFSNSDYYTNLDNYNQITYEDAYIGSMVRKSGLTYGKADDFTLIYPKFETDYSFSSTFGRDTMELNGRFEHVLIGKQAFETFDDPYDIYADKYMSYLYGNSAKACIRNEKLPDGPKILLIKDSFMVPVAAFLSTMCSEVHLIDPRYDEGDMMEEVNSIEGLDLVIVSFSPQNLTDEFFFNE